MWNQVVRFTVKSLHLLFPGCFSWPMAYKYLHAQLYLKGWLRKFSIIIQCSKSKIHLCVFLSVFWTSPINQDQPEWLHNHLLLPCLGVISGNPLLASDWMVSCVHAFRHYVRPAAVPFTRTHIDELWVAGMKLAVWVAVGISGGCVWMCLFSTMTYLGACLSTRWS